MRMRTKPSLLAFVVAVALLAPVAASAQSLPSESKVNGAISVAEGQAYDELDTVNGAIRIARGGSANEASTVNGAIRVEDEGRLGEASTVNGAITLGAGVVVERDLETVNGGINLGAGSRVGGDVETVNGGIVLVQTEVGGGLATVNGDISVGAGSRVGDGITVERPSGWSWGRSRPPRVTLAAGSTVEGEIRFEREVEFCKEEGAIAPTPTGTAPAACTR
jgi:DUF4097 and DUF4098 domain-containing protein YvlB